MSATGSASSQGTHSRSPSRSRSPPYNDGRYPHPPPPLPPSSSSSKYNSSSSSSRYDYSYGRPSRGGISVDLDSYRDLRERERDRERDRDRAVREDRYLSSRGRDRDRDDRYPPYYRDDPHHYPPHLSRDYPKMSSLPLRREDSKDPKLPSLKEGKDDPAGSDMPPSYNSSRYSDWRERERERRYREEDRRREYDRRRSRYMRYDPYSMSPYGGGDTYRPDRDRDRDMPPPLPPSSSVGGPPLPPGLPPLPPHPYYDRMDDRDYYGPGGSSGSGSSRPPPPPPSGNDRYRSSSGRGRSSWRDRPERISTSNLDMRSGRSSPTTPYSATSTSSTLRDRQTNDIATKPPPPPPPPPSSTSSSSIKATSPAAETSKEDKADFEDSKVSMVADKKAESPTVKKEGIVPEKGEVKDISITDVTAENEALHKSVEAAKAEQPKEETSTGHEQQDVENSKAAEPTKDEPTLEPMQIDKPEETIEETVEVIKVKEEPTSVTAETDKATSTSPPPSKDEKVKDEKEGKEDKEGAAEEKDFSNLTQEQIVERIDDIENRISTYEEMLKEAIKREEKAEDVEKLPLAQAEEDVLMSENENDDDDEVTEEERAKNKEEAKKQALQAMESDDTSHMRANNTADASVTTIATTDKMRKRPQLLINQLRAKTDNLDDELYEKILRDNQKTAKQNSAMLSGQWQGKPENADEWTDEEAWSKPLYNKIEDYPCFQENMARFAQLRIDMAHTLHDHKEALQKKERRLKNEYKRIYKEWKEKNLALDRMRAHERKTSEKYTTGSSSHYYRSSARGHRRDDQPEEYSDGVIFIAGAPDALRFKSDGTSTPYGGNGHFTSDAARSEAELLEIIQSLESAEMRNPESRAKKTTATIPPMILDERERLRTYDDRSGLVKDPLTYYHTGPDTGDAWNQQEVTTFMESYMMYPKQFERIAAAIGTKNARQCVLFYYRKKKKIDFKALMKKGRRGKSNKHRDRIAAAIRAATGDGSGNGSSTRKKAKSKGSALMTDIGEAQISRKAKEKDAAERKTRELRDLEETNAYWGGVNERRTSGRGKRYATSSSVTPGSAPTSSASDDTDMILQQPQAAHATTTNIQQSATTERRRVNSNSSHTSARRRGRMPREPTVEHVLTPTDGNKRFVEEPTDMAMDYEEQKPSTSAVTPPTATTGASSVARWTERDKEIAIEAFKQFGRDFTKVANVLKTKTEEQCRNFYHNFKRKYGANVFNEEDARQQQQQQRGNEPTTSVMTVGGGTTTLVLPPRQPPPINPATVIPSQATIHNEVVASGRTDLKADEEDAAAALMGMFQMGANTPRDEVKQPTQPQPVSTATNPALSIRPMMPAPSASTPNLQTPTTSTAAQQPQRRRRVRSSSSRAESLASQDTDVVSADSNGRKPGRGSTLAASTTDNTKRSNYSSYWSVLERNDFQHYLSIYGPDWEKVANAMKSKTMIQVRNFYTNNEEKLHLKDIVNRYYARQQQQQQQQQRTSSTATPAPAVTGQQIQQPQRPSTPSIDMPASQPYPPSNTIMRNNYPYPTSNASLPSANSTSTLSPMLDEKPISSPIQPTIPSSASPHLQPQQPSSPYMMSPSQSSASANYYASSPQQQRLPVINPGTQQYPAVLSSRVNSPAKQPSTQPSEPPSAVTKVADLLNNNDDESTQPNQKSWETWFGS